MKRFLLGAGWSFVFWMGALIVGGAIVGAAAGSATTSAADGARAGEAAGEAFGEAYGGLLLLVSLAAGGVGTFMGWLPGTKPENEVAPSAGRHQAAGAQALSPQTVPSGDSDPLVAIKKLGELMEAGMITEEEYESKKAKLLALV